MKKIVKMTFAILMLSIMTCSLNVFAEDIDGSKKIEGTGTTNCGETNVTIDADTTLTNNNIGQSAECFTDKVATIELTYKDATKKVEVTNDLLKSVKEQELTLIIHAKNKDGKELYTATLTSNKIAPEETKNYNVTVWLEALDDTKKATLKKQGYNGIAFLKAASENNLNATYEINAEGILANGTYPLIDEKSMSLKSSYVTVEKNILTITDASLLNSYIFDSKVIENTPAPAPTPSTGSNKETDSSTNTGFNANVSSGTIAGSSNVPSSSTSSGANVNVNSNTNTGSSASTNPSTPNDPSSNIPKEVVEFKKDFASQTLSIPGSKYEDVIKETITSDENLKDKLADGANVVIKSEKAPLTESAQNSFKAVIKGGMILNFVDIKINLQSNNQDYPITNLKDKIELSLTIPPAPVVESGYYREYYVLREHDGNIEKLDSKVSEDGKTITFSSDKFSVYAVGYRDQKIDSSNVVENPQTGDHVYFMISTFILSIVSIYLSRKRVLNNK